MLIKNFIFLISFLQISYAAKCKDPSDQDLAQQMIIAEINDSQNIANPPNGHASSLDIQQDSLIKILASIRNIENQEKEANINSTKNLANNLDARQQKLSDLVLCPWRIKNKYQKNTYPRWHSQAECLCQKCNTKIAYLGENFGCKEIILKKLFLKRETCVNGIYEWEPYYDDVAIACECTSNTL